MEKEYRRKMGEVNSSCGLSLWCACVCSCLSAANPFSLVGTRAGCLHRSRQCSQASDAGQILLRMEGNDRTEQSKCSTLVIVTLLHYCFKLKNANHCTARWSKFRENCTHSKVRKRKIINYIVLLPPQNDLFFLCLSFKV